MLIQTLIQAAICLFLLLNLTLALALCYALISSIRFGSANNIGRLVSITVMAILLIGAIWFYTAMLIPVLKVLLKVLLKI